MAKATGGITISGTIDGTSVIGEIAVINGPLLQYFDGATVKPDWNAKWANGAGASQVPILYPKMHDTASGADLTGSVSLTRVTYNDTTITWGNDGKATAPSIVAGKLLKTTYTYGTDTIECVKFIGNPASESTNPDDDRIAFYGTCVSSGGQVNFSNVGIDIQIRRLESTETHDVYLTVPTGYDSFISRLGTGATKATRRLATLMKNGDEVNIASMSGYVFKWADITDKSVRELSNGNGITISTTNITNDTITIDAAAVNSMMLLRCRCYDGSDAGANVVATYVVPIFDLSDELQVRWKVGPYPYNASNAEVEYVGDEDSSQQIQLRKGDAMVFRPVIFNRQTGEAASAFSSVDWDFSYDDSNGNEVTPTTAATTKYAVITYNDVVQNVSGTLTKRSIRLSATTKTDVQ